MGPLAALGLLLCVRLCAGECRAGGSAARGGAGPGSAGSVPQAPGSCVWWAAAGAVPGVWR